MELTALKDKLAGRMSKKDVLEVVLLTQGAENDAWKEELYQLSSDPDLRTGTNALWCLTHFSSDGTGWLHSKHDELIDRVMAEKDTTKCRLMLRLLLNQPFEEEGLRADFIDYCVGKITACSQPYAVRASCIKLAYEQMRHYPELLDELEMALDLLSQEPLSAGLLSAKRQVMKKIGRQKKKAKRA